MRMLRRAVLVVVTVLFAASCSHLEVMSAEQLGTKCSEGTPVDVRIPVNDDGTVDPIYETVYIGGGTKVEWYLREPAPNKELRIRLPPARPGRFKKTKLSKTEVKVEREGVPIPCEGHKYKIKVFIDGKKVSVDPILIIRE